MVIKEYFQLLFPFLIVLWLVFRVASATARLQPTTPLKKLVALVLSAIVTFYPFTGLSLAEYFLSLNPSYSLGSLALMVIVLWPRFTAKPLLSDRHLFEFCLWNVSVSLVVYLSSLGFVAYDAYALGYHFSFWFLPMALITVLLIWRNHPLSYIFLAYILFFNLKVLPSNNFFDYITDGFLFVISFLVIMYVSLTVKRPSCLSTNL